MLRNLFAKRRSPTPAPTYADMFEVMRYDRGMDVMPYAIAYRLKPPFLDRSGSDPNFALLDTESEIEAFMDVLRRPMISQPSGVPVWPPLQQWNDAPSRLMAEPMISAFYYPDDEKAGWPELVVWAYSPAILATGQLKNAGLARGRYAFEQFPSSDKKRYVEMAAAIEVNGPRIFIDGKVPFSMVEMLNPRQPGSSDQ